jgi:hypothetical protein
MEIPMLFEVAILELPTKKETQEGSGQERLVLKPVFVVAKESQAAAIIAALENSDRLGGVDHSRMAVLVRPFA